MLYSICDEPLKYFEYVIFLYLVMDTVHGLSYLAYQAYLPVLVCAHKAIHKHQYGRTRMLICRCSATASSSRNDMNTRGFLIGYLLVLIFTAILMAVVFIVGNDDTPGPNYRVADRVALALCGIGYAVTMFFSLRHTASEANDDCKGLARIDAEQELTGKNEVGEIDINSPAFATHVSRQTPNTTPEQADHLVSMNGVVEEVRLEKDTAADMSSTRRSTRYWRNTKSALSRTFRGWIVVGQAIKRARSSPHLCVPYLVVFHLGLAFADQRVRFAFSQNAKCA